MKWEDHESNEAYHSISLEVDWSELSDNYDRIVTKYTKILAPVFRSGKVPKNFIEMRFQKEIIDELSRVSARRFGRESVRESSVDVLGHVEVEEIECAKGQPFRPSSTFI
jgi:FKBP-type peptidyl-prolyl cis-trans isomerase (trigger factor)